MIIPAGMALVQGAMMNVAPALVAASQHLRRLPLGLSAVSQADTAKSPVIRSISSASSPSSSTAASNTSASLKIKQGLRSFAAQPALQETDMFCFQVRLFGTWAFTMPPMIQAAIARGTLRP